MALESASYLNGLVSTNPAATDNVSQGDDHLRLIKSVLKNSFPSVDTAVNAIHTSASAPATAISAGLIWFDTANNVLKIRNEANTDWVTLAISPETSNSVDINAGTIDGTPIGATSASTGKFSSVNIAGDGATVTGIKDEDDMASNSATKLATQQSIKAYVDSQVTAQDLDVITDSGSIDIDLDSEALSIVGGEGIDTSATGTTVTIAAEDATTSNKGVASFDSAKFTVTSGAVTTQDSAIVGATSIGAHNDVDLTGLANDYVLKYSSTSGEWQPTAFAYPDKLSTKGDLLVYNTVDAETRLPVGTNDYALLADSTATNGVDWKQVQTATIADDAVTADKLADTAVTPGSYTASAITVDQQGRITSASSGSFIAKTSGTGSGALPSGTTAERDGSPNAGYVRFNSDTSGFEGYNGSAWGALGGGATGAGGDEVFYENEQTVTTNYTITSNENAMSAGPVTVNTGVTVTVPSGSTWVIV